VSNSGELKGGVMRKWLPAALDYIPRWIEFQMRHSETPGCVMAIAAKGEIVLEQAFGVADLGTGEKLTPRHRFRVASHSKSFTAAGIMKLREQGRLELDDAVGRYVEKLHPAIAEATIAQLLSHSAGLVRDGADAGQWQDRRPFLSKKELRAALAEAPTVPPNTRFKYSNHGFGLAGLVIEAITGERYRDWIRREIVEASGLHETEPDMPIAADAPMARGHGAKLPLGHRLVIPGDNPTHALAAATGFVSTAADLARFFGQLDPDAKQSTLSVAGRREMTRQHWQDAYSTVERHYGLGIMCGTTGDLGWFGHGGAFQGFISRTVVVPQHGLTVSIVTNTVDRLAEQWSDGVLHILSAFGRRGAPEKHLRDWTGRWWYLWSSLDLVPMGERVMVLNPALMNPLTDASELEVTGADAGRIALATGLGNHGEPVRRHRSKNGAVEEVWLGGTRLLPEAAIAAELEARYGKPAPARARR
jgi:CubicO group peptidase (beta-lactamase class C family)